MSRKAVDVVLLPTETMTTRAIEANAQLVEKFGAKIVLDKNNCLPHISLAMGCAEEEEIPDIGRILEEIAKKTSLGKLHVIGIAISTNSVGEKVSVFQIERAKQLQSLHEEVMGKLRPYLSYDVTKDMLYGPAEVEGSTLLWIRNYRDKSSFANFSPHITIGYGQLNQADLAMEFEACKLALCHLGNHCTCRKILTSVKLKAG